MIPFWKYHGLGNDYLVVDANVLPFGISDLAELAPAICDRHFGIGSDGILADCSEDAGFRLRIINPDGSEAEKSGNGLRIFARYLWDRGRVGTRAFDIDTPGGRVRAEIAHAGASVTVDMGRASFHSQDIPVSGASRDVIEEPLSVGGRTFRCTAVTVGNPHCVIFAPEATPELVRELGPLIENEPRFPNRTNVQFVTEVEPDRIRIEIWERGAGYTLASGSSSCAAAACARRLGRCGPKVRVQMPGGSLDIEVGDGFELRMRGPVTRVADGVVHAECWSGG